jgi:hypothetical protein
MKHIKRHSSYLCASTSNGSARRERERERKVPGVRAQHWAASRGKGPKAKGRREMVWRQRTRMFVSV